MLTGDLAFVAAYALGRGLDLREVAAAAGVSSSTVLRFANRGMLAEDSRAQALLALIAEHDRRPAEGENQDRLDSYQACDPF